MAQTLTGKIIAAHVAGANPEKSAKSNEIGLKIDQTLTQDATGTMAYLQFEAIGVPRVKTELSVAYVDHNTLQTGFENPDDHIYIASAAKKFGLRFAKPGTGVCHQVHLERFAKPGKTLIGSDSHTPTAGGLGMLAFGAGGLDVAMAMGGGLYYITNPKVVKINLTGKLRPFVSAKDVILEILRRLSVKGGVGKVMEYTGEGVKTLSVPERATITNMGAELGATSSIFPSDEVTRAFLEAQGRGEDYIPLSADDGAVYDEEYELNLSELEPLIACPHSPDNVKTVKELAGMPVDQVCIGSCTNSSYADMMRVAAILKGKTVAENVSLVIAPGSRQVLTMLADNGALSDIIAAGARIMECACGPCIGMGQSPGSGGVSLRTYNRNFEGRSGTKDAKVYLVSPETAAVSAIVGRLADPTESNFNAEIPLPDAFCVNDSSIILPADEATAQSLEIKRGPNIKPFPINTALPETIEAAVLLKVGDNITTDHIMPAGSKILPLRSNIPAMSQYCFAVIDPMFASRAKAQGGGFIVGGQNYGQGSSREHAALVPLYLGVKAVIAKSFARMHRQNLINNGILPLTFKNEADYDRLNQEDNLRLPGIRDCVEHNKSVMLENETTDESFELELRISGREVHTLLAGGLLNTVKHE
jgi:aconitate hydratase